MSHIIDEQTRVLLYAAALQKLRRKENALERVRYLRDNPEHLTEDDLDMFRECDGRTIKSLFAAHPNVKQKYHDYNDSPDQILSSLIGFTRRAWPHIRDANEFYPNWHLDLLAGEYEDIYYGVNDRLIVNQPPGTMKSYLLNVFFPAWVWAQDPTKRFAHYSYTDTLPNQQKEVFLRLITSPWYTKRFGKFRIVKDNEKDGLVNSRGGTRVGGGVGGALYTLTMVQVAHSFQGRATAGGAAAMITGYTAGGAAGSVLSGAALQWQGPVGLSLVLSALAIAALIAARQPVPQPPAS